MPKNRNQSSRPSGRTDTSRTEANRTPGAGTNTGTNRRGGRRQRHLSVRGELRDAPDVQRIARAVVAMALAQAEAEAQAQDKTQDTSGSDATGSAAITATSDGDADA